MKTPFSSAPPVALTIAGSDSGGGAGIQADLRAFAANGVFAGTVITALTAQNTCGVQAVQEVSHEFVGLQLDTVLADFSVRAVKTGMLANRETIRLVADRAAAGVLPNLVVDPVLVATSGDLLLPPGDEDVYRTALFPHARVVTPNVSEAAALLGRSLETHEDVCRAARSLGEDQAEGPEMVVITGSCWSGGGKERQAVDLVWRRGELTELRGPWSDSVNTHGTGCSFSAALAAFLARGASPLEAAWRAKAYVSAGILSAAAWRIGKGRGPIDHFPKKV